jgi:hypothetical protein
MEVKVTDEELFAILSEIADEEIMAKNRASIIEVGRRIISLAANGAEPRLNVETLKPGQEFNTSYYGRVRFIRWDHYMGQRTAEIDKIDFGGRCNPLPETLQAAIDEYTAPVADSAMAKDAERLDWLDRMNAALNRHYGTTYQWKVILSQNITRLMTGRQWAGFVGDIDLNDAQCGTGSFANVRQAIDAAIAASAEKGDKA